MSDMFTDTCNGCGLEYPLLPQSDQARVYLFLETPSCNGAVAQCPACGFVTRLFGNAETIMQLIGHGLKVSVCLEASDEIIAGKIEADADELSGHQERYEEWLIENATDDELRKELGL